MPKHKPIKFETTLEPNLKKYLLRIIKENSKAKTTLNATLALIATGGILTFGVAFPNVLGIIEKIRQRQKRESYEEYRKIWYTFNKLKQKHNLEFLKEEEDCLIYTVTENGKKKIKKFILDELKISVPKNWDGNWRLVIFDIPENQRKIRDSLRNKLEDLNFYQCQKSVWVHPFPCIEEIEFLKDFFNIKPLVKIFLVKEMTDEKVLYYFKNLLKSAIIKQ
ncbi:MAG: phenylacetic acid degradation operon negative regulatory protein [Parcubacteria group bacterium Athens0714_24]|nr:MAG: phenylacetic acid degradation operon negative regulatory protein [Parcubacteria group bacterium Athens0714_24]